LGWWTSLQESAGNALVLRYEDLQHGLATYIRRLGAFLGKHLSPDAVSAIAAYGAFASMSANPFINRARDPLMDFSIARFLRKGVVGDWKTHFTAAQNARFNAVWEQRMAGTALRQYFAI
jgi:hypothetical protein